MAEAGKLERGKSLAFVSRRLPRVVKVIGGVGLLVLAWWLKPYPSVEPRPALVPIDWNRAGADAEGALVYSNDFNSRPGSSFPHWSSSAIAYSNRFGLGLSGTREPQVVTNVESPNGRSKFLGEFGGPRLDPTARTRVRQAVRLALEDLAPHSRATVSFDLLILKSWDGNSPQYGPDRWSLRVEGGPTLLDTSFSNNPKVATEKSDQDFPQPGSRPGAGASSVRTLGYRFFGDSVYHLSVAFPHTAETLVLEFAGDLFEGKGTQDESWGLDDVVVRISGDADR